MSKGRGGWEKEEEKEREGENMCPCVPPCSYPQGLLQTHVALDGEDLGSELLDAHIEVSNLAAAALEAVPKLG